MSYIDPLFSMVDSFVVAAVSALQFLQLRLTDWIQIYISMSNSIKRYATQLRFVSLKILHL